MRAVYALCFLASLCGGVCSTFAQSTATTCALASGSTDADSQAAFILQVASVIQSGGAGVTGLNTTDVGKAYLGYVSGLPHFLASALGCVIPSQTHSFMADPYTNSSVAPIIFTGDNYQFFRQQVITALSAHGSLDDSSVAPNVNLFLDQFLYCASPLSLCLDIDTCTLANTASTVCVQEQMSRIILAQVNSLANTNPGVSDDDMNKFKNYIIIASVIPIVGTFIAVILANWCSRVWGVVPSN